MSQISQNSRLTHLCQDPETEGFDLQAGQSWIYPTNYPLRDYQYNIIQQALLKNTLVSLPTGLGKTFIAAVVMYNFYRWYPHGKIIFMAPTRPLVKQQIDACYDIMAIPKEITAELTGSKVSSSRNEIWNTKRVFFVTPQVLQNDLDNIDGLGKKIKCVVIDEAHRAKGNHAYCEVIRKLTLDNKYFRVLALSATPGSTLKDVSEVINNLLISKLEFRTEESIDVQPYVFQRSLETIVVPLGEKLQEIKDKYIQVLEYYTKTLVKYRVIQGNCSTLTKGKIFMTMKEFQQNTRGGGNSNYGEIMKSLNICITLYHAFELLVRHGLRSFLSFFEEHIDKPLLRGNTYLVRIMDDLREYLGPPPNIEQLPDGTHPEIPANTKFGHPKFYKLRDVLIEHFNHSTNNTRVIVFFEYRESVMEAYALLLQTTPLIKPRIFLGQGNGVTQRVQINVVKAFREGTCNTLLSTCIGEEGLDVGDVDLIVCFDISNASPIRMVQRMGRTGRKKEGKIYILVTEGKEQQTLKNCLIQKENLVHHVLSSREISNRLNSESPRLVPKNIVPKCEKLFITVRKNPITKNSSIKDMLRSISSSSSEPNFSQNLEIKEITERLSNGVMLWNLDDPMSVDAPQNNNFSKYTEKLRILQPTHKVNHSKASQFLVNLLQFADSKRFNIPTQATQNRNMKQGDIRSMFLKPTNKVDTDVPILSTQENNDLVSMFSNELFLEISNYLAIQTTSEIKCKICPQEFDCTKFTFADENLNLSSWTQPSLSILDNITAKDLDLFTETLNAKKMLENFDFDDLEEINSTFDITNSEMKIGDTFCDIDMTQVESDVKKEEKSFSYQPPKTLQNILNKYSTSIIDTTLLTQKTQREADNVIDDKEKKEILSFFKLNSLEELFEVSQIETSSQETIIYEPEMLSPTLNKYNPAASNSQDSDDMFDDPGSPIICSLERSISLKTKAKLNKSISPPRLSKLKCMKSVESPSKFSMDNTKLSSTPMGKNTAVTEKFDLNEIEDICDLSSFNLDKTTLTPQGEIKKTETNTLGLEDICDLSIFGLSSETVCETQTPCTENKTVNESCTISHWSGENLKTNDSVVSSCLGKKVSEINKSQKAVASQNKSSTSHWSQENLKDLDDVFDLSAFGIDSTPIKVNSNTSKDRLSENSCIDLTQDSPVAKKTDTQLSITQMLSLVEKESKKLTQNDSQKENKAISNSILDDLDNFEEFNFTFNAKKTQTQNKLSLNKTVKKKSPLSLKNTNKTKNVDKPKPMVSPVLNKSFRRRMNDVDTTVISSDDEFEPKPKTPVWIKPMETKLFRKDARSAKEKRAKAVPPPPAKRKKTSNDFLDAEAVLSDDEVFVSEDEEEGSDQDCYEASFIADETQDFNNHTQMHANYLRSIRSPVLANKFKIPHRPRHNIPNVYSQDVDNEDDSYANDSFCVNSQDVETPQNELSELEILELKLKEQRKRRKKSKDKPTGKRRIIQLPSDDSD